MNRFKIKTACFSLCLAGSLALPTSVLAKDSPALELARQLNQAFIEVADQVSPAVVVIEVQQKTGIKTQGEDLLDMMPPELRRHFEDWTGTRPNGRNRSVPRPRAAYGRGSGIVISVDGYILTNNHVVENADKITIRFKDGKQYEGQVKGTDPESDIAVVKIKATGLTPAKLGDSDKTRVGEFAVAIGAPFDLDYTVTVGHVSAKGRSFEGYDPTTYSDQDFIQTDACINPGNSGGPLVNLYGEVIGINSMIRVNTGIGFAIPINLAIRVKNHLITDGKFVRSWIGVRISELKNFQKYKDLDPSLLPDVEEGVVIDQIEPNGPAAKSSLKPSDVVVAVNGSPVKTSRQLKDLVSTAKVGDTITLDVVRGKKHVAVKINTEAIPGEENASNTRHKGNSEVETTTFGLSVQSLNSDLAKQFEVEATSGVIVTEVEPNSPAADQGIKPGDIITEINRKPVSSVKEFREALKDIDTKRGMIMNLISNGISKFVVLKEGE